MRALKLSVTVDEDHEVLMRLPEDFPAGPAEVIILESSAEKRLANGRSGESVEPGLLESVRQLRLLRRTTEEDQILGDFESFRRANPFQLSSLRES